MWSLYVNVFMRKMKFYSRKKTDRCIAFNQNDIHDIHLKAFVGFFKSGRYIFFLNVCWCVWSISFRSWVLLNALRFFIATTIFFPAPRYFCQIEIQIPLRLLMSLDICTYYCGVVSICYIICLDVNNIQHIPLHIIMVYHLLYLPSHTQQQQKKKMMKHA